MSIDSVIAGTTGTYGATAPSVTAMNGTYTVYSTWNSASQYSNGVAYIGFNGSNWVWTSAVNGGGTSYATASGSSSAVPTSGWSGSGNPTLAALTTGLPVSLTASGAGSTSYNDTYVPISGGSALYQSTTQYCGITNSEYLTFDNGQEYGSYEWILINAVDDPGTPLSYVSSELDTNQTVFPLTGWTAGGYGTYPAPTFSAPSNGNFFYML